MTNTIVEKNTSYNGGGLYVGYRANNSYITGSLISENGAGSFGGGICNSGSITVRETQIVANTAQGGGGVFLYSNVEIPVGMTIENNSVVGNNVAAYDGGGIFVMNFSNLVINGTAASGTNVTFYGNSANSSSERDPANDAVYASNILNMEGKWTTPFTQGYNNYDICQDYTEITYAVIYNVNGGTPAITPDNLHIGDAINTAPGFSTTITKADFVFDGWFLDEELTMPVGNTTLSDVDIMIYAKWRPAGNGNPNTGDVSGMNIALVIGTMAMSAGAVYVAGKKRKH